MILLIGLVTKNSILLVEYINQLKERGLSTVRGGARGRPHPAPADPHDLGRHRHGRACRSPSGLGAGSISRRPLGYAIVGGVLFSTLLTLYVVPAVYVIFDGLLGPGRAAGRARRAPPSPPRRPSDPRPAARCCRCRPRRPRRAAGRRGSPSTRRSPAPPGSIPTTSGRSARWTTRSGAGGPRWRCSCCPRSPPRSTPPSTRPSSSTSAPAGTRPRRSTPRSRPATICSAHGSSPTWAAPGPSSRAPRPASSQQRFRTALLVESDYYAVLQNQELSRVAADRTRRAEEGLGIARARVVSGAAVQSDSLQLVLELTQARTDQLRRDAALTRVAAPARPPDRRGRAGGRRAGGHGRRRPSCRSGSTRRCSSR